MAQQNLSRPRAVPTDFVEMEHPDVESTFRTSPDAISHWEARGWKRVGAENDEEASQPDEEA